MKDHKKSDTLSQRDKARRDFLELKEMQRKAAEEGATEHVAYSDEIKPKTFWEKVKHFWYYYKKAVVAIALAVAVLTWMTVSCINKKDPDLKIVIYDNRIVADMYIPYIEEYFEKHCPDYNGDGEVKVSVINCTFETGKSTAQYQNTMMQRLQSLIVTDEECMLIITGEAGYDYFTDYINGLTFCVETSLPASYYSECAVDKDLPLPSEVKMYCRDIKGTLIEGKEKSQKAVENGKDFIKIISEIK